MRFVVLIFFLIISCQIVFAKKNPLSEGFLLLEKKDYRKAFSVLSSLNKKEPFLYTAMGMSKALSGEYERAIDYLLISIEDKKESNNWVPNFFIGLSFYNLRRFKEAIPFLERSYNLNPEKESLTLLGRSFFEIEDYKKSEEIFSKLYNEGKNEDISLYLIKAKINQNKISEAEDLIKEAINLYPQNPFLLYERAKLWLTKGQVDLAERDLESALSLSRNEDILKTYSSIKSLKKPQIKEVEEKKVFKLNYDYLYYLSPLVLLTFGIVFVLKRKREKGYSEKLFFAKTLLLKADYISSGNIFSELTKHKKFKESAYKGLLASKTLLGKLNESILMAENLMSEEDKFFYLALIYLYFGDKDNFSKNLNILEQLGLEERVKVLKKLSYSDKNDIADFIIKEV